MSTVTEHGTLLEVAGLSKAFAGVRALSDVSFGIQHNEVLAILGPNGSGKTTLFNVVSGFMRPTSGTIHFLGQSVGGLAPALSSRLVLYQSTRMSRLYGTAA